VSDSIPSRDEQLPVRIIYRYADGRDFYIEGADLEKYQDNMELFAWVWNTQASERLKKQWHPITWTKQT